MGDLMRFGKLFFGNQKKTRHGYIHIYNGVYRITTKDWDEVTVSPLRICHLMVELNMLELREELI